MLRTIKTLQDVVDWDLCTGCGACYYACSDGAVSLVNIESVGIRPRFNSSSCAECTKCLSICPGFNVDAETSTGVVLKQSEADHAFGPALEIWEGYAADPEIRYRGSSGGILSALALYCLEREGMAFVLHTAMDQERPWLNKTVCSRTRSELLERTGSRYAPASPCEGMAEIENSASPCVFIGKPCDTAAAGMLRVDRPELDKNLGLVLSFFCAGTPSTKGTLDLIKSFDVRADDVEAVHYRGEGWPGEFRVLYDGGSRKQSLSYEKAWGALTHYRSLRCNLCPDGLGRVADISCGDAWENSTAAGEPGLSIVIVRTARGQEILHRAIASGYVKLQPVGSSSVFAAQVNLLRRRTEIFGRLAALRIFGIPVPRFRGFSLFRSWVRLSNTQKLRTLVGTARRVIRRRLYHPQQVVAPMFRVEDMKTAVGSGGRNA